MAEVLDYLKKREWSMGNGQCPDCCGVPAGWFGHPNYLTPEKIGHAPDCELAAALRDAGDAPLMLGDFRSDLRYELCTTKGCLDTKVAGDPYLESQEAFTGFVGDVFERAFLEHLLREEEPDAADQEA